MKTEAPAEDRALDYDARRLLAWRADQLLALGFSVTEALLLVHQTDIVHDAAELVERGCDPRTAMKILL